MRSALSLLAGLVLAAPSFAQPAGWGYVDEVRVINRTNQAVAGYQGQEPLVQEGSSSL